MRKKSKRTIFIKKEKKIIDILFNVWIPIVTEFMDNGRTFYDVKWSRRILSFMSLPINGTFIIERLWSRHEKYQIQFNVIELVVLASTNKIISLLFTIFTSENSSIVEHIFMFWNGSILFYISINKIKRNWLILLSDDFIESSL